MMPDETPKETPLTPQDICRLWKNPKTPFLGRGRTALVLGAPHQTAIKLVYATTPPDEARGALASEAHVLSLFSANNGGGSFHFPRYLAHGFFDAHTQPAEAKLFAGYIVMSRVPGSPIGALRLALATRGWDRKKLGQSLGQALRTFHDQGNGAAFDHTLAPLHPLLEDLASFVQTRRFPPRLHSAGQALYHTAAELLARPGSLSRRALIHGDFHAGNTLTDSSGRVISLIDFSRAGLGFAALDFVNLWALPNLLMTTLTHYESMRPHPRHEPYALILAGAAAFTAHSIGLESPSLWQDFPIHRAQNFCRLYITEASRRYRRFRSLARTLAACF